MRTFCPPPCFRAIRALFWVFLATVSLPALERSAHAEDRALIIGIENYKNPRLSLPGVRFDIAMMEDTAQRLGFTKIKTLRDSEASVRAVKRAIRNFLGKTKPKDRALVYFSGHGTSMVDRNNDEADNRDEALVMYEASGGDTRGLLIDDDLGRLLRGLKAKQIYLFIDACHSGTVYKSYSTSSVAVGDRTLGVTEAKRKVITIYEREEGKRVQTRGFSPVSTAEKGQDSVDRLVAFTAARDTEEAVATSKGSIFTLGLNHVLQKASSNRRITFKELVRGVRSYVKERDYNFQPQVFVGDRIRERALRFPRKSIGPMRKRISKILSEGQELAIRTTRQGKTKFKLGEKLVVNIDIPQKGYLNIVTVDPNDTAEVIFPNKFHEDNKVKPGKFRLPSQQMNFDLPASEPTGRTMVAVFLTTEPLNFRKGSTGVRTDITHLLNDIGNEVAYSSFKAFSPQARTKAPKYYAAKLDLTIVE